MHRLITPRATQSASLTPFASARRDFVDKQFSKDEVADMVKQQYDEEHTRIFYQCVMGACPTPLGTPRCHDSTCGSRSASPPRGGKNGAPRASARVCESRTARRKFNL
jgi:hypothetical protein